MPLPLQPLTGTGELGKRSRCGIQKHWPLKNKADYYLHWDYIQKVNYAVQDFNKFVAGKRDLTQEDVVFAIVLADWIDNGVEKTVSCYRSDITSMFAYSRQEDMLQMRKFFRAVRSFVSAHPLDTNRHPDFGLEGSLFCIDIRGKGNVLHFINSNMYKLTPAGLAKVCDLEAFDTILYAYSKNDDGVFYHRIGVELDDIRRFASLCIDKLYEFDMFLGGLKKRDF